MFSRDHGFLLAGCGCYTRPGSRADDSSDCSTLSAACDCADERTSSRASTDLGDVALGVALADYAICIAGNSYWVTIRSNGSEMDRQLAGSMQPSAGFS